MKLADIAKTPDIVNPRCCDNLKKYLEMLKHENTTLSDQLRSLKGKSIETRNSHGNKLRNTPKIAYQWLSKQTW